MKLRSRALIVVAAAAAVVAPVGGAPASAADVAATVNGADITVDDFEATLLSLGAPEVAPGDAVRGVLTEMIANQVVSDALIDAGIDPDEGAPDDEPLDQRSARLLTLFDDAGLTDGSDQEEYEETGRVGDLACALVVFGTDEDAVEAAGEDLLSSDGPAGEASDLQFGGLGGSSADPCNSAASLGEELETAVSDALEGVTPGATSEVVEIDDGTYAVFAIPAWDAVESLLAGERQAVRAELVAGADVAVNARYGRWDAATGQVVALDAPDSPEPADAPVAG